jgi:hypothetical protein
MMLTDPVNPDSPMDEESKALTLTLTSSVPFGLSTLHGIGANGLSTVDQIEFNAWKRTVDKSIANCKVIMFSGKAWLTWKKVIMIDVSMCALYNILTVAVTPSMFTSYSALEKEKWKYADMLLQNYLAARLSEIVRMSVTDATTSNETWQMLEEIYANSSLNSQNQLTDEWHELRQKAGQSIHQFIQAVDYMAMTMKSAGVPRTEQEKLHRLLRGASTEWNEYLKMCTVSRYNYKETCSLLIEIGRTNQVRSMDHPEVKAFSVIAPRRPFTRVATCMTCGAESHASEECPSGLKRGVDAQGRFVVRCFNCMVEGHVRKDCPKPKKSWGAIKAGGSGYGRGTSQRGTAPSGASLARGGDNSA